MSAFPTITTMKSENTLARRLGLLTHISPLRFRLARLAKNYLLDKSTCLEDWLIDVANARGIRVVFRPEAPPTSFCSPHENELSNEELIAAICQPQCLDRPQMLRLAAQMISRNMIDPEKLIKIAIQERATIVIAELARLAIHIEPGHATWQTIQKAMGKIPRPKDSILHWTRLAEPVIRNGVCDPRSWRLVA